LVSLERVAEEAEDENPEAENPGGNEAENAVSDTEGGEA
jgi:DNA gyrase, A subunit